MSTLVKIKDSIIGFVKKEVVLSIAIIAAIITCFFVPPDAQYLGYFEEKRYYLEGRKIDDYII